MLLSAHIRFVAVLALLMTFVLAVHSAETTYTVQKKDTLSTIAREFETTAAALTKLNGLKNPNRLTVGQKLKVPAKPPTETAYTVKKGDILSSIARKHNVTTQAIVAYNNLPSADKISVGQTLKIPLGGGSTSVARSSRSLPASLEKELAKIRVRGKRWRYIVIHHSATDKGTIKGMDEYHRTKRRMENGLAYHFVIGNGGGIPDGQIEIGNRWRKQLDGGHLASSRQNHESIGICLVGNFDKNKPTKKQMESLHALSTYLTRRCKLSSSRIKIHLQINKKPTRCPGKYFPYKQFLTDFRP